MSQRKLIYLIIILFLIRLLYYRNRSSRISFSSKDSCSNILSFDDDWQFSFDENSWTNVPLPHTTRLESIEKIEQQWQGTCFYRKQLMIKDNSSHLILRFEAAMHEADVWINGQHIA